MRSLLMLAVICIVVAGSVYADAPTTMNYQGLLTDGGGSPVADSSYSVVFTIYDAAAVGNSKWTETQNVTTTSGLFAVLLGSVNPVMDTVFNGTTRYLGIKIETDAEISPRTALVTVPYAFRVATVDGATGGNIGGKLAIGWGHDNSGSYAFVAGSSNISSNTGTTVSGGQANDATGSASTIGGGRENIASSNNTVVSGGADNVASGHTSAVGGGRQNHALGQYSVIAGGGGPANSDSNIISGDYSTIGGGQDHRIAGFYATISGGDENSADGHYSTIPGGGNNVTAGYFSFAAGLRAKANHDGCFVWADSSDSDFASTAEDQFLIRAGGGVGINTTSPTAPLTIKSVDGDGNEILRLAIERTWAFRQHGTGANTSLELKSLTAGNTKDFIISTGGNIGISDSAFNPSSRLHVVGNIRATGNICADGSIGACSDRRYKRNIRTLTGSLGNVLQLRGVNYAWKRNEFPSRAFDDKPHTGFIAQELEKLYPEMVLTDDEGYKSVDYGRLTPVLVEAIKEQQSDIDALRSELDDLKKLVTRLATQSEVDTKRAFGQN